MKLGIFDSGLGGLLITKAVQERFPDLDILYLGDTLHLPYGNRSAEAIYAYTLRCMEYMFAHNCRMIIIACNTASATALRRLQQTYLPKHYPDRRILGVIVPTIEHAADSGYKNIGVIGTNYTVSTNVYEEELKKIDPQTRIILRKTPLLVPLIENEGQPWIDDVLRHYIDPLVTQNIEALILGCTHYAYLKKNIKKHFSFDIIAQDEIIPEKLELYFKNHPEIYNDIGREGRTEFQVTDLTENYERSAQEIYGRALELKHVEI
ncbi:MAG: glutamate racemase [Alphaproteobacteria bacterium]|nr:glutamate racemase [Alphaproteobacteria bacterium]